MEMRRFDLEVDRQTLSEKRNPENHELSHSSEQSLHTQRQKIPHRLYDRGIKTRVNSVICSRGAFTIGDCKDPLGYGRTVAIPILEYLDTIGFTRREGEVRVLMEKRSDTDKTEYIARKNLIPHSVVKTLNR
jgi:hypothetical protein